MPLVGDLARVARPIVPLRSDARARDDRAVLLVRRAVPPLFGSPVCQFV